MEELVLEKTSQIDLEPTFEEIDEYASRKAAEDQIVLKNYTDWVDLCCMVENYLRRERGLI